jgi:hypothetical protein
LLEIPIHERERTLSEFQTLRERGYRIISTSEIIFSSFWGLLEMFEKTPTTLLDRLGLAIITAIAIRTSITAYSTYRSDGY